MLKMNVSDAKVVMLKGEKGSDIASIEKTASDGLVDSYTITLTDKSKHTFNVANGSSIASIKKTSSSGLTDTYTVTLTNGNTTTFNVANGNGIVSIKKTSTNALIDTYTINYNNGSHGTFNVTNGRGITSIKKTGSSGVNDTYTITYNDGTTSTYNVVNADAKELTDKFDSLEGMTTGKFLSGTACVAGNFYIANDKLYKCIANTDGTIPITNTTYFKPTTVMDEIGARTIRVDKLFSAGYTPVFEDVYSGYGYSAEIPLNTKYDFLTFDNLAYAYFNPTSSILRTNKTNSESQTGTQDEPIYSGAPSNKVFVTSENKIVFFAKWGTTPTVGSDMNKLNHAIYGVSYGGLIKKNF